MMCMKNVLVKIMSILCVMTILSHHTEMTLYKNPVLLYCQCFTHYISIKVSGFGCVTFIANITFKKIFYKKKLLLSLQTTYIRLSFPRFNFIIKTAL